MESSNTIIPLYDRVKNQVYDDFQRLKRQQTVLLTVRSKRKKILALKEFRSKFLRFFYEIYSLTDFDKLDINVKKVLIKFANNILLIKNIGDINNIVLHCTISIRLLGITKISYDYNNESF
jgi:uncharacterized hydantoinase/oxoprolinase family protein